MFENVREDIRVGTDWHSVPRVRRMFGDKAERAAAVALSSELQVVLIYRFQAWCRARRIPLAPLLFRKFTMVLGGVSIGDRVSIGPGIALNHGHIIIDGVVEIGSNCSIAPFVTIGLNTGGPDPSLQGPAIGDHVFIGTGAKVLGPISIGENARIGANAVVLNDVPAHHTAIGVPATSIPHEFPLGPARRD